MLETIKKLFNNTASRTLTEYYNARLQSSNSLVEVEAILTMNALLSLNEADQHSESLK